MLKPLLLAALLLAGCSDEAPVVPQKTLADRKAERRVRAEEQLSKTPVPRTYTVGPGEMMVVEVPVADEQHFVEKQRCFIYRDAELKQVTMSCAQQTDVLVASPN